MNEILKKRIEEAANDRYTDNTFAYKGFIDGAEYALSHQWINVEESLPEEYTYVIVADKYGHVEFAYIDYIGKWSGTNLWVTHWMPIPKFEPKK